MKEQLKGNKMNQKQTGQDMKYAIQKIIEQMNVQAMINGCRICQKHIAKLDDLSRVTSIKLLRDINAHSWHIVVRTVERKPNND